MPSSITAHPMDGWMAKTQWVMCILNLETVAQIPRTEQAAQEFQGQSRSFEVKSNQTEKKIMIIFFVSVIKPVASQ